MMTFNIWIVVSEMLRGRYLYVLQSFRSTLKIQTCQLLHWGLQSLWWWRRRKARLESSKPLINKMRKRCVRDSHSSGEKTMEQNREVHSCKIIKTERFIPEITNVPCSEDKLVSPVDEPPKSSEEPDNVLRKPQEVQGPQVVRASCRLAAKPRKVHSLVSCIHKRLQGRKTLEVMSRVGDENGQACQETDIKDRESISSDEIPKDRDKGGKQDTGELMTAPDLFNTKGKEVYM